VNPIRLVSGAVTLPAHAAAAVIGTSVGVATTGVRTTARVVGRVIEQVSGSGRAPAAPWPADRPTPSPAAPVPGARTTVADVAAPEAPATEAPATMPAATKAPATKAPAKKPAAKKAATKKTAAKKSARKAPSKEAAVLAPALGLSEDEVEAVTEDGPVTPSGIPAAGEGFNPDTTETDLHQPGTEPLMDPSTVKAVASESDMMRRAADIDKG
jgi:hypothetical protein